MFFAFATQWWRQCILGFILKNFDLSENQKSLNRQSRIEPISPGNGTGSSVWSARRDWEKKHGPLREKFSLPRRDRRQTWRNPLEK